MGLDSVELVISVERAFDIEIPDKIAETLVSVGRLHAFVVLELRCLDRAPFDDALVFARLRALICDQLGIAPERVVPEARFVEDLQLD